MNLLQIRTQLVKQSGRFDLVVDTVNYADNGANHFITSGQRLLDRMYSGKPQVGEYRRRINTGEELWLIPNARSVSKVFLRKAGHTYELAPASKEFLRQSYDNADSTGLTNLRPMYYAIVPYKTVDNAQKYSATVVTNGTFDSALTGWTQGGSGLSQANGRCYHASGASATLAQTVLTSGRTYLIQCRAYQRGSGTLTIDVGTQASSLTSTGFMQVELVADSATLTVTFSDDYDGWIDDLVVREVHDEFEVDFADGGELLFPTSVDDASQLAITIRLIDTASEYTLCVEGKFYTPALVSDTDTSYWSTEHPQLLIDAARYYLERSRRAYSSANEMLHGLRLDVRELQFDDAENDLNALTHSWKYEG